MGEEIADQTTGLGLWHASGSFALTVLIDLPGPSEVEYSKLERTAAPPSLGRSDP